MKYVTLLTITEFSRAAKISRATIYNMLRDDVLTTYLVPNKKKKYINPQEVLKVVTHEPAKLGKTRLGMTTEQRIFLAAKKEEQ